MTGIEWPAVTDPLVRALLLALVPVLVSDRLSAAVRDRARIRDRKRIQGLESALADAEWEIESRSDADDYAHDRIQELERELVDQAAVADARIDDLEAERFSNAVPGLAAVDDRVRKLVGELEAAEGRIRKLSAAPDAIAARSLEADTIRALESDLARTESRLQGLDAALEEAADWIRTLSGDLAGASARAVLLGATLEGSAR